MAQAGLHAVETPPHGARVDAAEIVFAYLACITASHARKARRLMDGRVYITWPSLAA